MSPAEMLPEIVMHGKPPVNPLGTCFDSAARLLLDPPMPEMEKAVMCHGIITATLPGQEGVLCAHAWLEFQHPKLGMVAVDPIWHIGQPVKFYRRSLKAVGVVTYSRVKFLRLWQKEGYPGPWEKKIQRLTKEGKAAEHAKSA